MTTPLHTSFPSSRCEQGRVKLCALIPMQRFGITKLARFGATQPAVQKQINRQVINFRLCPESCLRIERPRRQMPVSLHICSPLSDLRCGLQMLALSATGKNAPRSGETLLRCLNRLTSVLYKFLPTFTPCSRSFICPRSSGYQQWNAFTEGSADLSTQYFAQPALVRITRAFSGTD